MLIAVLQLTSKVDPEANLKNIRSSLKQASSKGAEWAFLPECFLSLSNGLEPTSYLIDPEDKNDPYLKEIRKLSIDFKVSLIGGSVAIKAADGVRNRAYNFDSLGNELSFYDKRKLFACDLRDTSIDESMIYTPGSEPSLLEHDGWKVGLGICFDLRYPEFSYDYRQKGAEILTFASAFTVPTGRAHWHVLLRARAIESQSYVVAAAQCGENNERIRTYGHSLVVSPWGEVLMDLGEKEDVGVIEIDKESVQKIRKKIKLT